MAILKLGAYLKALTDKAKATRVRVNELTTKVKVIESEIAPKKYTLTNIRLNQAHFIIADIPAGLNKLPDGSIVEFDIKAIQDAITDPSKEPLATSALWLGTEYVFLIVDNNILDWNHQTNPGETVLKGNTDKIIKCEIITTSTNKKGLKFIEWVSDAPAGGGGGHQQNWHTYHFIGHPIDPAYTYRAVIQWPGNSKNSHITITEINLETNEFQFLEMGQNSIGPTGYKIYYDNGAVKVSAVSSMDQFQGTFIKLERKH